MEDNNGNEVVFCPLVDADIVNYECLENIDVADGNILERTMPERFKVKENWRSVCKACKWHNY